MKVAVALTLHDVTAVIRNSKNPEVVADDDAWSIQVAQPAMALANNSVHYLSTGWGSGTGYASFLMAVVCVLNFIGAVHDIRVAEPVSVVYRRGGTAVIAAMGPFFLAADASHVSTRCESRLCRSAVLTRLVWLSSLFNVPRYLQLTQLRLWLLNLGDHLMQMINRLRLQWDSTKAAADVHRRVWPLQVTLQQINHGQGLGFSVYSKVLDRKTLNLLAFSIISFIATAIPFIMAFMPDPEPPTGACKLTPVSVVSDSSHRHGQLYVQVQPRLKAA